MLVSCEQESAVMDRGLAGMWIGYETYLWAGGNHTKTLYKKTVQHNVDDDILTKQCFPRAPR
jgi:NADH dehydrogenase FAD-containing subunit